MPVNSPESAGRLPSPDQQGWSAVAPLGPRVVLGGFSQGGAVALLAALSFPRRLAGCAIYGGWLSYPTAEKVQSGAWVHDSNLALPVWWGHGEHDRCIPACLLDEHSEVLDHVRPVAVEKRRYSGGHFPKEQAMSDMLEWTRRVLGQGSCSDLQAEGSEPPKRACVGLQLSWRSECAWRTGPQTLSLVGKPSLALQLPCPLEENEGQGWAPGSVAHAGIRGAGSDHTLAFRIDYPGSEFTAHVFDVECESLTLCREPLRILARPSQGFGIIEATGEHSRLFWTFRLDPPGMSVTLP
ncbi:unnamed protein product [Prorocentrum cordatum]|uniref:Phospholipase/carboxylesterase/thioesterase domain-containing protein n=1 Tax=Prorocentrum cordatum TaxID=2364126 RepID=A0ABN9R886_9DINO|nr:unnamed protein product [Polarella glacialis]